MMNHFCEMVERRKHVEPSQSIFTCSKFIIETLEQGVKYVQVNNKDSAIGVVLVSLLLTLNIFHTLFQCFYC